MLTGPVLIFKICFFHPVWLVSIEVQVVIQTGEPDNIWNYCQIWRIFDCIMCTKAGPKLSLVIPSSYQRTKSKIIDSHRHHNTLASRAVHWRQRLIQAPTVVSRYLLNQQSNIDVWLPAIFFATKRRPSKYRLYLDIYFMTGFGDPSFDEVGEAGDKIIDPSMRITKNSIEGERDVTRTEVSTTDN